MKEIKQKIPVSVEIIMPVHVGSGSKLTNGQDYILKNGTLSVISVDKILAYYGKDKRTLSQIEDALINGTLVFSSLPGFDINKFKIYEISNSPFVGGEILSFLKDPFLKPYIPGSSIKGAIRTVILQHFLRNIQKPIGELIFDGTRVKDPGIVVFGKDALYDPMKALVLDDFYFTVEDLAIFNAKLFDLRGENSYGWKKMGRNEFIADDISEATPISLEALSRGSKSCGEFAIDLFFLENYYKDKKIEDFERRRIERLKDFFLNFFNEFKKIADEYAKREIQDEISFLEKLDTKGNLTNIIDSYRKLKDQLSNDRDSIYLRIAWGIGWKGMTGDYFDERSLEKLRQIKKLGKDYSKIFPKTRRFIVEKRDGTELPAYPLGWIKLREVKNET
jgi:CRISPR/Cas system CSM-associated protein Csm5 (group 7 of RAMP superfamily)